MSMHSRRIGLLLSLAVLAGCHDATSPNLKQFTHPSGNTGSRLLGLGGRPFGIFATTSGEVLVTEQDLNAAVHLDSIGTTGTSIAVGGDPGDVIANRAGTQAFVSNFFDGTVSIVDLHSNTTTNTVRVSPSNAYRQALSADEGRLYVTSTDGHLYTITTSSQTAGASVALSGSLQGIALARKSQTVYVTSTSGTVWRLQASSLATLQSGTASCSAQEVALSVDETEVYVACENGGVRVLDPTTLAVKSTIVLAGLSPFGLAVSPDNAQLYVTSPTTGAVAIVDRASRSVVTTLAVQGMPRRVAFNAHGNKAYIANEGNWIDVIE